MSAENETRLNEWFVPKFGPTRFRVFVGLLFLPYTGMCISFAIIGSMLAGEIAWDRVCAIALIYALALGISAHVADSLGSKKTKPWGSYFTKVQLLTIMAATLTAAYAIGVYYIAFYVPLLAVIAVLEGFFLFTYNYEIWDGIFHNDFWFAMSWGSLPLLAGYIMQTNSISISRPYKQLKQRNGNAARTRRLENGLKAISAGTITFALSMLAYRIIFS